MTNTQLSRREYAEQYWQLKKAISAMHRAGNYVASAFLRVNLNLVFRCWQHLR